MDALQRRQVSHHFSGRVEYCWEFDGRAWDESHYQNGRLREPPERVSLERVLQFVRGFDRDQALRFDLEGAQRLGL